MNRDEAQFILRAYRTNCEDASDAQFEAALALAKQDPALARWFAEEQALDGAYARKIRSAIPVPPDLKHQLLLARATAHGVPWWRRGWIAIAASAIILLAVGAAQWQRNANSAALRQFRHAMVQAALDRTSHADVKGIGGEELRRWLVSHGGESNFVLPVELADRTIAACKIVEWQNTHVTMLCYKFGDAHLDLFVVDASHLPNVSSATVQFASAGDLSTATWRQDGKLYLLVSNQSPSELKRII